MYVIGTVEDAGAYQSVLAGGLIFRSHTVSYNREVAITESHTVHERIGAAFAGKLKKSLVKNLHIIDSDSFGCRHFALVEISNH